MRTMKFRAWDKESRRFLNGDFSLGIESGEFRGKYGEVFNNIDISQFTGLHDKNGKEIYEGDVFKSILNSLGDELMNPKLVYEELRWVLKDSSKNRNFEYMDYYEVDTELEVIGNAYENHKIL